ncbi:MAG: hypothetical protein N3G21_01250 [Candidatus Hydrogenedentes bacterium]|nr:hypothetical protein [Candidatus Hydrogenedentota bacterium]
MNVGTGNINIGGITEVTKVKEAESNPKRKNIDPPQKTQPGEIPIGLSVPGLIPTGSIFIPKELVLPEQKPPTEIDVVKPIADLTIIPNKLESPTKADEPSAPSASTTPTQVSPNLSPQHLDLLV